MSIAISSFPDRLDPQLSDDPEVRGALWAAYTPLLTYRHEAGEAGTDVIPGLAEGLPAVSEDGTTYTLKLREGLRYSDGRPIRAADFEFALERLFDLESPGARLYEGIAGAREYEAGKAGSLSGIETDDSTREIAIELLRPDAAFEQALALTFAAPVPAGTPSPDGPAGHTKPPPASGPYRITEVDPPRRFVMEPNPRFDTIAGAGAEIPAARVDRITVTAGPDPAGQAASVARNELDLMAASPPAERVSDLRSRYPDRVRFEDSLNVHYLWLNNREPPFNDVRVRQAVNSAIDREAMAEALGEPFTPTEQIVPRGMPGHEDSTQYPGPDLETAEALMAEANPSDTEVTVWTDDEPGRIAVARYYRGVLDSLGFKASLEVLPRARYALTIGDLDTPNLDTGLSHSVLEYPHPDALFESLLAGEAITATGNRNLSQTDIPELDARREELGGEPLGEAEDDYAELDRRFMEQAVWAPYGSERFTTFASKRIELDQLYHHVLFGHDYASISLQIGPGG